MDKINVDLYGGKGLFGGKETPLEADEIYCDKYAECSFYKERKCLRCRSFLQPVCKFGKNIITKGYTSRARKYYDFKRKYQSDEKYNALNYPSNCYAGKIGDTLFLNTRYVDVHERNERTEAWRKDINGYVIENCGFGNNYVFIPLEKVSTNLLHAIFTYAPTAIMGGRIDAYQKKVVPQILQELKSIAPDIYGLFVKEHPEFIFTPDYVGKRAYINSLKPGTKFRYKDSDWLYDGTFVISMGNYDIGLNSPWWSQGAKMAEEVKIKVTDKMTIEILDNNIVDETTKFA